MDVHRYSDILVLDIPGCWFMTLTLGKLVSNISSWTRPVPSLAGIAIDSHALRDFGQPSEYPWLCFVSFRLYHTLSSSFNRIPYRFCFVLLRTWCARKQKSHALTCSFQIHRILIGSSLTWWLAAIQLDLELLMAGCAARKMSKIYLICLHWQWPWVGHLELRHDPAAYWVILHLYHFLSSPCSWSCCYGVLQLHMISLC